MGHGNGLVLVVEGEGLPAELLRRNLLRAGFEVEVAAGVEAGLAAARALHPVAIVFDMELTGSNGTEVLRHLRRDNDRTPVLS